VAEAERGCPGFVSQITSRGSDSRLCRLTGFRRRRAHAGQVHDPASTIAPHVDEPDGSHTVEMRRYVRGLETVNLQPHGTRTELAESGSGSMG
jgi:hypothetical protein